MVGLSTFPVLLVPSSDQVVLKIWCLKNCAQILKAESCVDTFHLCEEDLSVDELKIYTEEELVEKALQEAFQNNDANEPRVLEVLCNRMSKDDLGASCCEFAHLESSEKRINTSASYGSLNGSLVQVSNPDSSGILVKSNSKKSRKRGRKFDRDCRGAELESSYTTKVKQLASLKQTQDEDKVAARLHSFNGSCNAGDGLVPSSENVKIMRTLRFINSSTKMKSSNTCEHVAISSQEVVLCVEIYNGIKTGKGVLGVRKHTLAELRDQIFS